MDSEQEIQTPVAPPEGGDPTPPEKVLSQADRDRLAGIVQKMQANGENDDNIRTAVAGFKEKYGVTSAPPPTSGGPSGSQVKSAVRAYRQGPPSTPTQDRSLNPNTKPFAAWEKNINDNVGTQSMLRYAEQGSSPQQMAIGFAPVPGAGAMPADMNQSVQLHQDLPNLRQQAAALKSDLLANEVANHGTVGTIVSEITAHPEKYYDKDGQLDYGKVLDESNRQSAAYGGGRGVGEHINQLAVNALQYQHYKPSVDKRFQEMTGQTPEQYLGAAAGTAGLMAHLQSDYSGEVARSQQIISEKAKGIFETKYQPELEQVASQFGQNSAQYQQAVKQAQQSYGEDLRGIQIKENQRLLRMRGELSRRYQGELEGIQDKNQDLVDSYNTLYNKAYEGVLQDEKRTKMENGAGADPHLAAGELFFKSLMSGLNSWAATRGTGLVAAGLNNPFTDFLRSRQTAAERLDPGDLPLSGLNLINPATYATRAGKMIGSMGPDLAIAALSKNPNFGGLEFTLSSTLSGMGDVYSQAKRDGYTEAEAQQKASDFAHANFITTLGPNIMMAGGFGKLLGGGKFAPGLLTEAAGGLGASLPQQYLEQAQSKEGKTLGQWLQEDAPQTAVETLVALAAGSPIMRGVGHLAGAMEGAKVSNGRQQLYSDIIDKQGPNAAMVTAEGLYLNGALDQAGLANAKQQITDLVNTKAGLSQLGVHPDYQKLFLQQQSEIQGLRQQADAATDPTMKKLLEGKIKEKEGAVQDIVAGKTPYLKFTTPTGTDFVVPADAADKILSDPAIQRDIADGHLRAQAFGEEKDVAPLAQKINDLASPKQPDQVSVETPLKPQITEVRHGETEEDQNGIVSGSDGVPLNDIGIKGVNDLIEEAKDRGFTKVVNPDTMRGGMTGEMISNSLGVPRETIPTFNSWDIGEWNGSSEKDYLRAEQHFVNNPDATEFEGKKINESFNQYKDRIIKARQELEDKNQGNTLLVNHSANMNVWDAYQSSGGKWDEAARQHYLSAEDAEPAVLPPTKEQEAVATEAEKEGPHPEIEQAFHEEKVLMDAEDPTKHDEIAKIFHEENSKLDEKATEPTGPVHLGGESESASGKNDGENGRSAQATADQERVPANDQAEGREAAAESPKRESLPDRFGSRDEFERALKDAATAQPVDKIASPIDVQGKPHTIEQYKSKAEAVQQQLFPDHSIKWYDTEAEYADKEQRPAGSAGVYDPKGKYLAFNLERIKAAGAENTIFHEVIHPIVHEALQSRPGAVDEAYSKLVGLKDVPGMDKVWSHEDQYRNRGLDTMKVEAITEFLTHVADGNINPEDLHTSMRTRIIDAINSIFKALGIDKVISTAQDISRLASSIKDAFAKADASSVKEALGNRPEAGANEKFDAIRDDDSPLRKLIQRAPDSMSDDDVIDAVTKHYGLDRGKVEPMVKAAREEQGKGLAQLVDDAIADGDTIRRAAQAAQIKAPNDGTLGKKLGRWFMDKSDDVSDLKGVIRQRKGEEEWQLDKQWKASEEALNQWNKVPTRDQLQFILGMERPDLLRGASQQTLDAAKSYRDRMDHVYDVIKSALPNINYIEDYFPHFWEKPDEVKNYFASTIGKAPLEGSKSFAKQRFYETILDGLRKGYKLTTTNPEELVRLAEANAWKFKTARSIFDDMQKMGYLKFSTAKDLPASWKGVDDKLFNRIGAYVDKEGNANLSMGQYMMPPDVANAMNEYLSLGLKGPVAEFVRNYNNIKNAFQLGVGAFHFGTTSLESTVSGVARGIQLLSTLNPGNMAKGLGQVAASASFVPNLAMDLRRGWKAIADYHAGLQTDDVQNLISANAKVGKQKMYSLDAKYNMMKAFGRLRADSDFSQIPKAAWNAMLYLPESLNKFLMEKWVPGLKVGGYLRSLDAEMAARKNMSPKDIGIARQKIWDSMDDRLGQVVYDNRFINKTVKDLGFMSIRSLGWTGGTLAAGAKGVGEIPLSGQRLIHGQGLTQRTAYLFALPLTVGLFGAYYQAMNTGKWPENPEDYFFPKDGSTNPDGTAHRVALPSYMKDLLAYSKSPIQTLVHKTSPILNDIVELYQNKDFYGEKIYGEDDPFYQRGLDKLKYIAGNLEPFSFRQRPGEDKNFAEQFTTRQGLEQKFGIMPAPRERERTDLENKIMSAVAAGGSEEGKTHEEMEQMIARKHLRQYLHDGGTWDDASDELKQKANVSDKAQSRFIEESQIDQYERYFKNLPKQKKINLWQTMTDAEKDQYRQYMPDDYDAQ